MAKKTIPALNDHPKKPGLVTTRFKTVIRPPRQFFRQWRKYRGLTLEQVAEKAGMTAGNISAMERGEQGYTPAGLQVLAQVYGTSPGWLLEVDPLDPQNNIFPLWERATESQRKMITDLARTVVNGRTGTDN